MKKIAILFAALLVVGVVVQVSLASSRGDDTVLKFKTLAPVSGPFVGNANPIRGVNGGGLPWQIAKVRGELRSDGSLDLEVKGLVLFDGAPVPPALQGTNPISDFKAVVSCLTTVSGTATTSNVSTAAFPATSTGDSEIETTVTLPSPCFAPIVFVTSPTGAWFAVTGR
jgi:hypothetical protein